MVELIWSLTHPDNGDRKPNIKVRVFRDGAEKLADWDKLTGQRTSTSLEDVKQNFCLDTNRTAGLAESGLCNGSKVCGRTNVGGIGLTCV